MSKRDIRSANFAKKKVNSKLYLTEIPKKWMANNVDQNEAVHNEPPHSDLHYLQIQPLSFLKRQGLS